MSKEVGSANITDEVTQRARAEAYRRYDSDRNVSEITGEEESVDDWGYADTARQAFIAGAQWQASRPFTEEDVEAAAIALHDVDEVKVGPWQFCRHKEAHREQARAALDAVTAHRTKGDDR